MAFGQGIGQGIKTYKEKKKRRDHNASKALAIRSQFDEAEEAGTLSAADSKLHKQLQNLEDLGSKKIESLVAEYETGEEMKVNSMKKSLLQYQVDAAQAGAQSRQGLADFTSKGYGETEAGFEGNVPSNLPEYLTRDYLAGDRGQMAAGAFPGEHYGDESKAVYEEQPIDPSQLIKQGLEGASEAMRGNPSTPATGPSQGYNLQGLTNLGIVDANGNVQFSQKKYDDMFSPAALDETKRQSDNNYYRKKLDETIETIADMEGRSKTPSRDFAWYNKELENKDMYGRLIESTNQQQAPSSMPTEENPWPQAQAGEGGLDPVVVPNTMADVSSSQPEAVEPEQTQQRLAGYETYGDGDGTPQAQLSDRMATGGTPATPVDERRGQLIDSLAQYNLTPTDRKQAIDMISEKYPKLKEFATTIVTADGEEIGSKVGNTFVKKAKGRVATPQGWRVKSRSVNQATGEETVTFENPRDLPTHVPTAAKYAETDSELTLTNENAPSEGQAKEFNTSAAAAKQVSADCKFLVDATKDASFFSQRLTDFKFKAKVNTIIATMKGKLRPLLIGPGAMSDIEQKMLSSALPDPGDFFRLDTATIQRFETLGELVDKKVKYHGEAIGLWDYKPIGEGGQSGMGGTDGDPLGKYSK